MWSSLVILELKNHYLISDLIKLNYLHISNTTSGIFVSVFNHEDLEFYSETYLISTPESGNYGNDDYEIKEILDDIENKLKDIKYTEELTNDLYDLFIDVKLKSTLSFKIKGDYIYLQINKDLELEDYEEENGYYKICEFVNVEMSNNYLLDFIYDNFKVKTINKSSIIHNTKEFKCSITGDILTKTEIANSKWCGDCKIIVSKDALIYNNNKCTSCNLSINLIEIPKEKI